MPRVGDYELEGAIGRGGMGVVYRARSSRGELVALKLLVRTDPASVARFDREVRLLRELGEAEGFVPIIDDGTSEQGRFLVMPFLGGGTLRDRLRRGPLSPDAARRLGAALARALAAAHERGIVHRDVKPENVLFTGPGAGPRAREDVLPGLGVPLLADLGIAKHFATHRGAESAGGGAPVSVALSRTGELHGTVGYLAPEQVDGLRTVDGRADIFALGAVLYEAVAGVPAFGGATVVEVLAHLASGSFAPLPASVPRDLVRVIESCLAARPDDRPRGALAVARALEGEAALLGPRRRRAWPWLAAGAVASGAVATAVLLATQGSMPPPAPRPPTTVSGAVPKLPGRDAAPLTAAELLARAPAWYRELPEARRPRLPLPLGLALGEKDEYVNEADGSVLVYVPAGEFLMGVGPDEPDRADFEDAQPQHAVRLSAYFIGKYEVSNAQWKRHGVAPTQAELRGGDVLRETETALSGEHVRAASWRTPRGDGVPCVDAQPVVQVLWAEAVAYARNVGLRLPTEAEWERAAGWDGSVLHRYPWASDEAPDETLANVRIFAGSSGHGSHLEDVRSHPLGASPVGALNMCGNAAELVLDAYQRNAYKAASEKPALDPCVFDEALYHVVRGGTYEENGPAVSVRFRFREPAQGCSDTVGFRVALSGDGSPRPRPR